MNLVAEIDLATEQARSQHGRKRECNQQRSDERKTHDPAELAKHFPGDPFGEDQRQEHHHGRKRTACNGQRDLLRTLDGRVLRIEPFFLAFPGNVLKHHDGVVHHHPDTQRKTAKGHHVDGETREVDQYERHQNRNRHGRGDEQCGACIAQEEQQDGKG